jgi:hypothetical protein
VPLIAKSVVLNVLNPVFVAKMTDAADVIVGVSRQAARAKSKGDDDFVFTVFFFIVLFWLIR